MSFLEGFRKERARKRGLAAVERHEGPFYLTLFVTNRCNMRCAHCFYVEAMNAAPKPELTAEQVGKLIAGFSKRLVSVIVTGGEPFIADELTEMLVRIERDTSCRYIDLDTNGYYPERIDAKLVPALEQVPGQINVQVSLDGLEATHNEIRKLKDSFTKAVEFLKRLRALQERFPKLTACALTCVNARNLDEVLPLRDFLHREVGIPHHITIVRGTDFGVWNVPKDFLSHFNPTGRDCGLPPIERLRELEKAFYDGVPEASRNRSWKTQRAKYRRIVQMVETKKSVLACLAGRIDGVVYPDGWVSLCEFSKAVGNLKDFDWDLAALWRSPAAEEGRRKLSACWCIHSCHLLHSMRYDKAAQDEIDSEETAPPSSE